MGKLSRAIRRLFSIRAELFERSGVRLLSDDPIADPEDDYFGFATFATALAEIVDNESTDTPLTVALSAPWGAGKTSVAKMMQSLLRRWVADRDGERARVVCWFNAWEHDDAPHLGAALAANVARTANKRRRIWWRLLQPLPAAMLGPQERWRRIVLMVVGTAVAAGMLVAFNATRELAEHTLSLDEAAIGGLGWLGVLWLAMLIWRAVFSAARDAARFIEDPGSEAARGSIAQVRDQLGTLIRQATRGGRMVIFVDDLERCQPARAVEIFEVASQLLGHPGVVTVLLADMRSLAAAAKAAYEGGIESADAELGRRYLEKLVQLELELPPPTAEDMRLLLAGKPEAKVPEESEQKEGLSLWELQRLGFVIVGVAATLWFFADTIFNRSAGLGESGEFENPSEISSVDLVSKVALLAALGGTFVTMVAGVWRWWERRRRRQIVERLEVSFEGKASDPREEPEDDAPAPSWVNGESKLESFEGKEAESLQIVHSTEIRKVDSFIQAYPPLFPRGAKRMLNHSRLLTKIARDRGMFGGEPRFTPEHLGKWIVLKERWPAAAAEIASRHSAIEDEAELRAASAAALECEPQALDPELSQLLGEAPGLAKFIDRLIYFKSADEPAPARSEQVPIETSG